MRIYSLIVLLALPLAMRSCQVQGLPTPEELVFARKTVTDSSSVIGKQKGYKGILIIGDNPETWHGERMKKIITGTEEVALSVGIPEVSIPEKNIVFFDGFNVFEGFEYGNRGLRFLTSGEHEALRLSARVANLPVLMPFDGDNDAPRIAENNILFVIAAGNTYLTEYRRDMWSRQHPFWQSDDAIRAYNNAWQPSRPARS